MNTSNFMIGPIPEGLRKDVKPYAIAENAFAALTNAYQFRGRVVRRQGYTLLGRLANNTPVMGLKTRELFGLNLQQLIAFDTTQSYAYDVGTNSFLPINSSITPINPFLWSGANYQFFFTTNYAGAFWATNFKPGLHGFALSNVGGLDAFTMQAGTGLTATVNVHVVANTFAVGDFVYFLNVTGPAAANNLAYGQVTAINVTGDPNLITVTSLNPAAAFAFVNGTATTGIVMVTTQSIPGQDGIRYYGSLTNGTGWANYNPPIDPNNALAGALLIFPYRGYLVFLNTWEGNNPSNLTNFGNRARWSQIGTPYYSQPVPTTPSAQTVDPSAMRDDLFGRGGANDAPTQEVIVGAGFIRDVLIVDFERSTWRLRFVNNAQNPFVWERINVELGSSCTFSTIPFDKGLMAMGNRGIVISDGNDVTRFDEKIPDDIFNIRAENNGFERVYGIRTFRTKLCYWTLPDASRAGGIFPDRVLVYNYETQNWAYFDDCFTCFGYYYPSTADLGPRWQDLPEPWPTYDYLNCEAAVSHSGLETIIAGNQQGFVFKLEQTSGPNSPSLYISAIVGNTLTSPLNNLLNGTWIKLTGILGTTSEDGVSLNGRNFKLANNANDPNNFSLQEFSSVEAGNASGTSFNYTINFVPVLKGSVQINVGALQFTDDDLDGNLFLTGSIVPTGTINYRTGLLNLTFNPAIASTPVYIRLVSVSDQQTLVTVNLTGAYGGSGLITKISNIDIQTKIFNFFQNDLGVGLSRIDFYVNLTDNGQFTCNVFADSGNLIANTPLKDNPQSNVVLTSKNPYQIGSGDQTIYRLFADVTAQTVQLNLTMSDRQMSVDVINEEAIEIIAMMISMKTRTRLV